MVGMSRTKSVRISSVSKISRNEKSPYLGLDKIEISRVMRFLEFLPAQQIFVCLQMHFKKIDQGQNKYCSFHELVHYECTVHCVPRLDKVFLLFNFSDGHGHSRTGTFGKTMHDGDHRHAFSQRTFDTDVSMGCLTLKSRAQLCKKSTLYYIS